MPAPFRADHVGSLLRPPELQEARAAFFVERRITPEQLREAEDKAILKALEMQRQAGVSIFSDGEYRRTAWSDAWAASVEGLVPDPAAAPGLAAAWRGPHGEEAISSMAGMAVTGERGKVGVVVGERLRQVRRLAGHESSYLVKHAPGPCKITMPGVAMAAANWYRPGITDRVYPTKADLVRDMVDMMQREIKALTDEGVSDIQIDSLRYDSWIDAQMRQRLIESGADLDRELDETVATDNACLEGAKREGVTFGLHICRGNNRSAWYAEGSYEPIAERVFSRLNVDRLLLEYDSERAGGFEPLRFIPKGKTVVLGLISSKNPELESQDQLLRRIDEASKYVPVENLALSPQCGFASSAPGNLLTWDQMQRKLQLVADTARKVWG